MKGIEEGAWCIAADVTWDLVREKWGRYSFGCNSLRRQNGNLQRQYRPFALAYTVSENIIGYEFLFDTYIKFMAAFENVDIRADFLIGDRLV